MHSTRGHCQSDNHGKPPMRQAPRPPPDLTPHPTPTPRPSIPPDPRTRPFWPGPPCTGSGGGRPELSADSGLPYGPRARLTGVGRRRARRGGARPRPGPMARAALTEWSKPFHPGRPAGPVWTRTRTRLDAGRPGRRTSRSITWTAGRLDRGRTAPAGVARRAVRGPRSSRSAAGIMAGLAHRTPSESLIPAPAAHPARSQAESGGRVGQTLI